MLLGTNMSLSRPPFPSSVPPATSVGPNAEDKVRSKPNIMFERNKESIKKMFDKVELSASCYDTAWVAMIPSPTSPKDPLFPQSLKWLLENQLSDGSWGLPNRHDLLTKDSLLSTLACVLALKQWGVGELQTNKGLQYIESNIASALDDTQRSPIGFDIIFPNLIEHAQKLDLNLPLGGKPLESFNQKRDFELKSGWINNSEGRKAYLAYISEGLGKSQNWEMAMKYQRKNGSLFNSPATTAAAYTHVKNAHCLDYLLSLLDKFGNNAVPTVHPLDVYSRMHMVDSLEKLGIDRHFKEEIQSVLDRTYRLWQQEEDDIFLEPTTCAMAFRLLRFHGYDVSSDALSRFSEDKFSNTLQGYLKDVYAVLELHKASQIVLHSDDFVLEELNSWTRHFLQEYLSSSSEHAHKPLNPIDHEASFVLRSPHHAQLESNLNRRYIEHYKVDQKRILKTSYSSPNLANKEFLELAVENFNHRQLLFREEFEQFNRWFVECGMDKLPFPSVRTKLAYCYLTAALTVDSHELQEARLTWAKEGFFACVVDDFYDVWASPEEQINLIQLMDKWEDVDVSKESCSELVKLIFLAVKRTHCEIADQAFKIQGRSVLSHMIQLWADLMRSAHKEAEWCRSKCVPTIDEYKQHALLSVAMRTHVLPVIYFVGPKIPQAIIESAECNYLLEVMSLYARFLNDVNSYKRDKEQGKFINIISLEEIHGSGTVSEEEIVKKIKRVIDEKRKELLRLVVKKEGSIVPRDAKDMFWKMKKALHFTYYKEEDVVHAKEMPSEAVNIADLLLTLPLQFK